MEQIVIDFEKEKARISEKVQQKRDTAAHLLVEAQKYENEAREFEAKIQIYQQKIEILMDDSNSSRKIADILRRESKKLIDNANNLLDIEIGDLNEKLRDFIQ